MKQEVKRLSILFAAFVISYFLRFIYQLLEGSDSFDEKVYLVWINSLYIRWILATLFPLFWDLSSIVAILVLHFISFRANKVNTDSKEKKKVLVLNAGHYKSERGLPTTEGSSLRESFASSDRSSFVQL